MKKNYIKIIKNCKPIELVSNFTEKEFMFSETALRHNMENKPNKEQWENIKLLIGNVLQPLRDYFGPITITSGFRTPELCRMIGSNKYSNHTKGQAADIKSTKVSLFTLLEWIYNNCEYRELIAENFPNGWVHVAYRENGNIKKLKLKDEDHNYSEITIDELKKLYS